jgi:hypothetical protein
MATSLVIPTPPADASAPVSARLGKVERVWPNRAAALDWAESLTANERELLFAFAIRLAANRPTTRGKTLTVDFGAAQNLVRVV